MKKYLLFIVMIALSLLTVGCFEETTTIEFVKAPKSVYTLTELETFTLATFNDSVEIRISKLANAFKLSNPPVGMVVTGTDPIVNKKVGQHTLTIKYESATIYWQYEIVNNIEKQEEISYTWYTYNTNAEVFELADEKDLFGFANIVNGTAPDIDAFDFAGKTVKLTNNMNLSDKVWTPIGEGSRKHINYADVQGTFDSIQAIKNAIDITTQKLALSNGTKIAEIYALLYDDTTKKSYDRHNKELVNQDYILFQKSNNLATGGTNDKFLVHKNSENKFDILKVEDFYNLSDNVFKGTFDGQNYTIKGLSDIGYNPRGKANYYVNVHTLVYGYSFGLFARASDDVTFKNVKFTDVAITGSYLDGEGTSIKNYEVDSAGALLGYYGNVKTEVGQTYGNLTVQNVEVLSGFVSGYDAIAGVVGRAYQLENLTIINSKNYATITGVKKVGGISTYFTGNGIGTVNLQNLVNYGDVTATQGNESSGATGGGIITRWNTNAFKNAIFKNCTNYGEMTALITTGFDVKGIFYQDGVLSGTKTYENNFNYGNIRKIDANGAFVNIPSNDKPNWGVPK